MDLRLLASVRHHQRRVPKLSEIVARADTVHVVAAALVDDHGRVLLQRRAHDVHQGGLWEFPGGKLEPGERRVDALQRELAEELGITDVEGRALIAVEHDYGDRRVLLDVWRVDRWCGEPRAIEGQPLVWVTIEELGRYALPEADRPVVRALMLPERYLITPSPRHDAAAWLEILERRVDEGIDLVQLRATELGADEYRSLAREAISRIRAKRRGVRVLLNASPRTADGLGADGVHLSARRARVLTDRPLGVDKLVAVSCHDREELAHAARIEADLVVLGPVRETASHPGAPALGWSRFSELVAAATMPVYALGGVGNADLVRSFDAGAQGVAAIRALWRGKGG